MTRREFTVESVLALLAGVTITITGCGGSGSPSSPTSPSPTPAAPTGQQDVSGVVSNNHGHTAIVTRAQITADNAIMLDIRGSATHTHTVALSAEQMGNIGTGQQVAVTSTTTEGHDHTVTFN